MDSKEVFESIKACILTTKGRLSIQQLNRDFKTLNGIDIPYRQFRFKSLEELIDSCADFRLIREGKETYVTSRRSEKSGYVTLFVEQQKSAKSKSKNRGSNNSRPRIPRFTRQKIPQRPIIKYFPGRSGVTTTVHRSPMYNQPQPFLNNHQPQRAQNVNNNINNTQFKNSTTSENPCVASRITIPPHSTLSNPKKEQLLLSKVRRPAMDKCLTSKFQAIDINSKKIDEENAAAVLSSVKNRLAKKISELNGERDSGNSSPNERLTPSPSEMFERTDNPLDDLKRLALLHNLGDVEIKFNEMNSGKNKLVLCKIKIGQKFDFNSYPNEFANKNDAQKFCCEHALTHLIPIYKRKSLLISSEKDILTRIPPMLEVHPHGIWDYQLKSDYIKIYNEMLAEDWIKIIDLSPCVQIEKVSDGYLLYHCEPGDKGQNRLNSGKYATSVKVPTNNVQFDDEGRMVCLITNVQGADEIWCQPFAHEDRDKFEFMSEEMNAVYTQHGSELVAKEIAPENYYVIGYSERYYRGFVVDINDDDIQCFLIDLGLDCTVPKKNIYILDRGFASIQAQAICCKLYGLEDFYEISSDLPLLRKLQGELYIIELADDAESSISDALPVYIYDFSSEGKADRTSLNEKLLPLLTQEIATPHLKQDCVTDVYVSHIESNADLYVHIRNKFYLTLEKIRSDVEKQIVQKPPNYNEFEKVTKFNSKEKLYFFKCIKINSWMRVKLIDWHPNGFMAQVYFVDRGDYSVITVANEILYPLESLNAELNNYPFQACRVRMALPKIPENFVEIATKEISKTEKSILKIMGVAKDDDKYIPLVKVYRRNEDESLFCVNESISLQLELIKKETENKSKFNKLGVSSGFDKVASTGLLPCPTLPKINGDFFKVKVIVAVNPFNFFIQQLESESELNNLMKQLQDVYKLAEYGNLKVEDLRPGNIYASKHDDGKWYRTSVIKIINSGSSVSVFYCDFGFYQTLPIKQLLPLDKLFKQLPYQALKARLAGIKPKDNKWTVQDCETFMARVTKKVFFSKLINIEKDVLYEADIVLKVALLDTSKGDDDVNLAEEFVAKGIAIFE